MVTMVNRSWLLTVLVGMILIYEATAITCVKCKDTDTDQTCGSPTEKTPTACTDVTDTCYMRNNGNKIERGCFKEEFPTNPPVCPAEEGQSCMTCSADGCNNVAWVKCHKCDESVASCVNEQELAGAAFCSKYVKQDQCYAKVADDKVSRGCKSDLPATNDGCTNNKLCDVCSGDGCNSLSGDKLKTFPKCLVCNSTTDAKCVDTSLPAVECDKRDDVCYTRLQANVLERGCLSTLATADQDKCKDTKDATCLTCNDSEGCNKEKWLKCHQCKEADVATCAEMQTDDKAQFCATYNDGNQCYERLESGTVVRGCEAVNSCKDNAECRQCLTDACNKEAKATLQNTDRCLQCSTRNDADGSCLLGSAANQPCVKQTQEAKKCYVKTDKDGVLTRGCRADMTTEEVNTCEQDGKTCELCETDKCTKVFPTDRLRCYQCNSGSDKDCSKQLTGDAKSQYCKVYKADDQCYARIVNEVFARGCQSDLTAPACDNLSEKECATCKDENCNQVSEERLKNSAGQKAISSILVATVLALVVLK